MHRVQKYLLRSFIVIIGTVIALLSIFWLPDLAYSTVKLNPEFAFLKRPILIWLLSSCIPFYYGLYKANVLLTYIDNKLAFTQQSVRSLSMIALCALCIAVNYTLGLLVLLFFGAISPSIFLAVMAVVFSSMTISFFAKLLQALLSEALQYKNENDLTI